MADGDCSVPSTAGEAKALGLKRFFTGRPCRNGHVAERYVRGGTCLLCQDIASTKWISADPGRARESRLSRYARFGRSEKGAAATKRIALSRQGENRPKVNASQRARQAARLRAACSWNNQFFMEEAYELSELRTQVTGIRWNVDHIVPLRSPKVCGLHVHTNIQVITGTENFRKGNRYWPDMA